MPPTPSLEKAFALAWPPERWQDVTVLPAVSGGADSVAMLRAMLSLKRGGPGRLVVAHFNHALRAEESDRDEAFVVDLCRRLGVPCEVGRPEADTLNGPGQDGIEAASRRARYAFLRQTAAKLGARFVVTAHTADDQAETILHRILRGTGVAGLSGMARARPLSVATTLIRPMLALRREEITAYLDHLGQPYRHDATNADTRFTRNRIRHRLIPMLRDQFNPGVVEAILRLGSLAGDVQTTLGPLVDRLLRENLLERTENLVRLRIPLGTDRYLARESLVALWKQQGWPQQSMGMAEWDALADMALTSPSDRSTGPAKKTLPGNISAEIRNGEMLLRRQDT